MFRVVAREAVRCYLYQQRGGDEVGITVCPAVENPVLVYQRADNPQGVIADKLSRLGQTIQTEWFLHPEVLQAVCSRWHQPQVDLFATRFNNKLPQFVSPVPDPRLGQWMHSASRGRTWTHMPFHQQPSWAKWWRSYRTTLATE